MPKSIPKKREIPERYTKEAKKVVSVAMARAGIKYPELCERLENLGITYSEQSLRNKISKGLFPADFLMAVLDACGERLGSLLPEQQ